MPVPFSIPYDASKIQGNHAYAVRVTISDPDGTLRWTSTRAYPVLTRGAGSDVEVLVEQVGATPAAVHGETPGGVAGTWTVTGYNNGKGAIVTVLAGTEPLLEFQTDAVSGSTGCNTFRGSCVVDGDSLSMGPLAATRKMCVAPTGVMDQERLLLEALAKAAAWSIDGDRLDLSRADGARTVAAKRRAP